MANSVLVIAESGSGKSTSIENLNPKETFIINVANKPLPFKGWKNKYITVSKETPNGNMSNTSSAQGILKAMEYVNGREEIKSLVVDDWQYMSSFEYFDRATEKGYDKFTQIASSLAATAKKPKDLRDDLTVYFLTHAEESVDMDGKRRVKAKTIGKMIDNTLTLEGLFSIVLFGKVKKDKDDNIRYVFETQNNGENTCKSPKGMFESFEIANDLEYVRKAIIDYEK
tara:strand:- start:2681 stop:3361 length:681 start_codon:yes stop_codon:yes gene_type:complete